MRNISFADGEYYHIYNRGTDKRAVFLDDQDFERFFQSMEEFNNSDPVGGLFVASFRKKLLRSSATQLSEESRNEERLVDIIAYCLNPNHFHLLLKQVSEKGIEKFMQRLGTGYTKYFNHKYDRTGVLFQGKFKAIHVDSNEYLLHVSAYVNLNFRVHQLKDSGAQWRSSFGEYTGERRGRQLCMTESILGQFRNVKGYRDFAEHSLKGTLERRGLLDAAMLLEE